MKEAYCRWFNKFLVDVKEHEMEQCTESKQDCNECSSLSFEEKEEG